MRITNASSKDGMDCQMKWLQKDGTLGSFSNSRIHSLKRQIYELQMFKKVPSNSLGTSQTTQTGHHKQLFNNFHRSHQFHNFEFNIHLNRITSAETHINLYEHTHGSSVGLLRENHVFFYPCVMCVSFFPLWGRSYSY